jgi:predicted HAD superfamily Cof-like phosphohydrolase
MIFEVCDFNNQILGIRRPKVALMESKEADMVATFLEEEQQEFIKAHAEGDIAKAVDALIDSAYFAIGGLYRLGLSPYTISMCFREVHKANMTKKKGVKDTRPQDGSIPDAVKPEGWNDPIKRIEAILFGTLKHE